MIAAAERWGGGEDERPYLPRAFSIARRRVGESHFLLEDVGPGTRRLCELREGDGLWALGPLGKGFSPPKPRHRAILVGGGVGIAPLAILQDALEAEAATDVTVLLGFRDGARAQGAALLHGARVATDDGSVGHHGLLTELLSKELYEDSRAEVYACGPRRCSRPCARCAQPAPSPRSSRSRPAWPAASAPATAAPCPSAAAATCACASTAP